MKQLGNLALVCAKRKDTLFQMLNGNVAIYIGSGNERKVLSCRWDDDEKITSMVYTLNFGEGCQAA